MKNKGVNTTRKSRPRVLVYAYLYVNLGDDLLVRILTERYPDVDFYLFTSTDYGRIVDRPNLHLIRRNRLNRIFAAHLPYQYRCYKFDAVVYIGGSIFMERGESGMCTTTRNLRLLRKAFPKLPLHIVGCNYGPEQTPQFRREVESVLGFVESVCMRDTYSYNLFASNPVVSCAPDVVFNLGPSTAVQKGKSGEHVDNSQKGEKVAVALSVIDLATRPMLDRYTARYEEMMAQIVRRYVAQGASVRLLSFCSAEGDVAACERIVAMLGEECGTKVEVARYEGDIDQFLATIRSSSVLYATRFHATILGALFGIPTIPIIYSDKTQHVLDDIGWLGDTLDLRNPCTDIEELQPHRLDEGTLARLRTEAAGQFASLDKMFEQCPK